MKKTDKKDILVSVLTFVIPVIIAALSYNNNNISIGGVNTLLIYDLRAQLLALYGYITNGGAGFNSFFYSMSGGLGGGFYGTAALYISPFDLLYAFVPTRYLPDAIYCMTLAKIGFSGFFCSLFIRKTLKAGDEKSVTAITLALSCCYALMSYNFMYAMSPMWLDLVMFLPLLAMLSEKVSEGKKSLPFILLLAFSVISDYYIAYMTVIALSMYFVFRLAESDLSFKDALRRIGNYAVHGLLSAGLAAFIILPVVLDFSRGKLSEDIESSNLVFIKNSLLEVIGNFAPSSYSTLDYSAPPNIFSGSIVWILALIFFLIGKKNIKARIAGLCIVIVYFASFIFGPVDRIWHGFRDPIGFPARYAFTFVFFMICFAVRGYKTISETDLKISKSLLSLIGFLLVAYTFFELNINGSYIISRLAVEERYANREEYDRYVDSVEGILDIEESDNSFDYARTFQDFRYSRYDGAMFGFDGLERFSSSYNLAVSEFLSDLGVGTSKHTISEFGVTPPVTSFLDMGYFISRYKDYSAYYDVAGQYRGFRLYTNPNRLSLIFGIDITDPENLPEFEDVPFENINTLYSDICNENVSVFIPVEYEEIAFSPEEYYEADTAGFADYRFSAAEPGNYWFYSEYVYPDESRYEDAWKEGKFSEVFAYANYYLDGLNLGMYRNDEFSYCSDIGYIGDGSVHDLALDTSLSSIGTTYLYRFDKDAFEQAAQRLNAGAFVIDEINKKGIRASGTLASDSYIMITLPYETGYEIYLDGKKTDYTSYRGSLILVKASAGTHDIVIRYKTPGFAIGVVISIISLIFIICFVTVLNKKDGSDD
jgi:uncharacterized membrane protein YfhO